MRGEVRSGVVDERIRDMRKKCEAAVEAVEEAKREAVELWTTYWEARGEYREGDQVKHPSLRGVGKWVVQEIQYDAYGEVYLTVLEIVKGTEKGWRRIGRDGLLRVVGRGE